MTRPLMVTAITFAAVAAASAADLPSYPTAPAAAAPDWTGFLYAGVSIGGRWSDTDWTTNAVGAGLVPPPFNPAAASFDSSTVRVGGYAGHLWRVAPAWVVGVEGDFAWGDSSRTVAGIPGTTNTVPVDSASVRERWDASLRGRLGFLVAPTILLYGTGGVAWQNLSISASCVGTGGSWCGTPLSEQNSWIKAGWTIGGGTEAKLWRNWLGRLEYRYADYGTIGHLFFPGTPASQVAVSESLKTHTLLLGFAYEFATQSSP